jgi:SAM-dependent methyltransferase
MSKPTTLQHAHSFHNPLFSTITHVRLLARVDRTMAVARAIERLIKPGMRVLDAGCGTGLMSFLAAKAGASEVVAIDRENVDLARALAKENGVSDKIRFIDGDLTTQSRDRLGGGFDAIVAFVYTNHLVVDEARSTLVYALREQFGRPNCTIIPDRVRYSGVACEWPNIDASTELDDLRRTISDMERRYQLSLTTLFETARMELQQAMARPRISADYEWSPSWGSGGYRYLRGAFRKLSGEAQVVDIKYGAEPERAQYPHELSLDLVAPGVCNTILWTQELWSDNHLLWTAEHMSTLATPVAVDARDRLVVKLDAAWRRTNSIGDAARVQRVR